ncbi:MAG: GerMN domain-containing protein [Armatimonadota bacterium]|nr:GerMN domain-containing protein [bacterium]
MGKKKQKTTSIGWVVALLLVAFSAAAGVTYYMSRGVGKPIVPNQSKPAVVKPHNVQPTPKREVAIYLPEVVHGAFYLVPSTRTTALEGDILDVAMKVLLDTTGESGEAGKLIPKGTELLSTVKVNKGVAVVNLSKEFTDNFSGGSTQESLVLNSIAYTLVDNSNGKVKKVQILVEGNAVETLGGHFELTDPMEPDSALLKPDK